MRRTRVAGLYAVTPDATDTAALVEMAREVLAGGAQLLQYRSKSNDRALQRAQAQVLAQLCRDSGIPFIINDHLDLALEIDADGVHLGRHDATVAEARRRLGSSKIIGASCYDQFALAVQAERAGADYVAFGAFFASSTKPDATAAPLELLARARRDLRVAIVAIGGATPGNAAALMDLGADAVAACDALFGAGRRQAAAESMARALTPHGRIGDSHTPPASGPPIFGQHGAPIR